MNTQTPHKYRLRLASHPWELSKLAKWLTEVEGDEL
jgi:hypothetical protein